MRGRSSWAPPLNELRLQSTRRNLVRLAQLGVTSVTDELHRSGSDASPTQIGWDTDSDTLAGMQDLLNWSAGLQASQGIVVRYIIYLGFFCRLTAKPSPSMRHQLAMWSAQHLIHPTTVSRGQGMTAHHLHSNASPHHQTANASLETVPLAPTPGINTSTTLTLPHPLSVPDRERGAGCLASLKCKPSISVRMTRAKLMVMRRIRRDGGPMLN